MAYSLEELKKKSNVLKTAQERSLSTSTSSSLVSTTSSSLSTLRSSLSLDKQGKKEESKKNIESRVTNMSRGILPEAAQMYKKTKVNLICFFDKSGSCRGTEKATSIGYKELVEKEKQKGYKTNVTVILFDENEHILCDDVNIEQAPQLNYYADGGTALYDTLVKELSRIKSKKMSKGEEREKTIVAIMTDGKDEHSRLYSEYNTRQIIAECKALGWEFIFLGANQNAQLVATNLGINPENAEVFQADEQGFYLNFKAIESAIDSYRLQGKVAPDWSKVVQENNMLALNSGKGNDGSTLALGSGKR